LALVFYRARKKAVRWPGASRPWPGGWPRAPTREGTWRPRRRRRQWDGREEKGKQSTSSIVALKPPHSSIFIFQYYSQFHMETSKTCNMKVVQTNESYNFAFWTIAKFQIFLKVEFWILNLN
jgi:hypothetical protein